MYIINVVHGPEQRSSGWNTPSNPQVSALIPRPAFNGMERMCQRHGSNQNSHPSVLVRKPLCNQFIHYHISSRRVFGVDRFKLCNFAVVAIECYFATVYRGSIIAILDMCLIWQVAKSVRHVYIDSTADLEQSDMLLSQWWIITHAYVISCIWFYSICIKYMLSCLSQHEWNANCKYLIAPPNGAGNG